MNADAPGGRRRSSACKTPSDLLLTERHAGQDIETLQECKTRFPQTRIIVMSAGGSTGLKLDYLPAAALIGANATLRKPFTVDDLLDTVRKVLQL